MQSHFKHSFNLKQLSYKSLGLLLFATLVLSVFLTFQHPQRALAASPTCNDLKALSNPKALEDCLNDPNVSEIFKKPYADQVKSHLYYQAMRVCFFSNFSSDGLFIPDDYIDESDASDVTKWFRSGSWISMALSLGITDADNVKLGAVLSGSTLECGGANAGWMNDALALWGYNNNAIQALQDFGVNKEGDEYDGPNSGESRSQNFDTGIARTVYGDASRDLSPAQLYILYRESLISPNGCNAGNPVIYATANATQQSEANVDGVSNSGKSGYLIKDVDATGNIVDTAYFSTTMGWGQKVDIHATSGQIDCIKIRDAVNQYADDFAAYVKLFNGMSPTMQNKLGVPPVAGAQGPGAQDADPCDIFGSWSLRWLVCPIFTAGVSITTGIDSILKDLLDYDASNYLAEGEGIHDAWKVFRNFALTLLIIAALVAVISQILGFSFLDAYTIKKVLPRLLIAIIGIALSWPILKFVIEFFNVLGGSIDGIIQTAFGSASTDSESNPVWANAIGITVTGGAAVGGVILAAGTIMFWGPLVLSLLTTAIAAVVIGLVVLGLRATVISAAVIIAPLAIAAYILPGTKKLWDFWQNTLITALLMYPIALGFIALCHGLAHVTNPSGVETSLGLKVLAFLLYFIPYFLLPFAFKLAGGLMKTIFSIADDKSKGIFDKQKKFRAERKAGIIQEQIDGRRGGVMAGFRQRSNAARHGSAVFGSGYQAQRQHYSEAINNKALQEAGSIGQNDQVTSRFAAGMSEEEFTEARTAELRTELMQAKRAAYYSRHGYHAGGADEAQLQAESNQEAITKARQEAARASIAFGEWGSQNGMEVARKAKMSSASAYNNGTYEQDLNEMLADVSRAVVNGSITSGDGIGQVKALAQKRPEFSKIGAGTLADMFNRSVERMRKGDDQMITTEETWAAAQDSMSHWTGADAVQADARSVTNMAGLTRDMIESTARTHGKDSVAYKRAAATASTFHQSLSGADQQKRDIWANQLMGQTIAGQPQDLTQTLERDIRDLEGDAVYKQALKTYQDAQQQAIAQQLQGQLNPPPPPAGGPPQPSDRRLKKDITPLKTLNGTTLYRFKYYWSDVEYVGVMAQDLLHTHPEALSIDEYGYYRVDYTVLGLEMLTYEEWKLANKQ